VSTTTSVFPAFLEMGLGVDLQGEDPTAAAMRAVCRACTSDARFPEES
jgi:hypothetical protein